MENGRNGGSNGLRANGRHAADDKRPVLITGGAGFIGTNLADRLLTLGQPVLIFDNLSRRGSERNLQWLSKRHGSLVRTEIADVRAVNRLRLAVREVSTVFHFAAQVAVTDSLENPRQDFDVNVIGTVNLLEALRELRTRPSMVFTSTNKVYGALADIRLVKDGTSYRPIVPHLAKTGVNESQPLDFYSPYGCSKGAADQYVLDYARTFELPAAVFRMSCIYGPHQFGTEDQGWVAHFLIRACEDRQITIYGDGMQARDVLFVEDLVEAFLLARKHMDRIYGQAFNIGGGPANTLSLLELVDLIGALRKQPCAIEFAEWRHADQRYYASDTRKFKRATGWRAGVSVREGVAALHEWLVEARQALPSATRHSEEAFSGLQQALLDDRPQAALRTN
ncbi:MAG TPA: GDP-mannose 4,6-dehydratase [Candidatus Acidoferrales bacterium]|nr:GDP-mannose 4,6-dehydratase [Candidatus Acidoferrales bacterium]